MYRGDWSIFFDEHWVFKLSPVSTFGTVFWLYWSWVPLHDNGLVLHREKWVEFVVKDGELVDEDSEQTLV